MGPGALKQVVIGVARLFGTLVSGWVSALPQLVKVIHRLIRARKDKDKRPAPPIHCFPVDNPALLRPEPFLYSQRALLAQGLAVTWDNPDIQLFKNGVPVSSSELETATTYDVQIRVWNNSLEAPAMHMPVHLSFLDFGIGSEPIAIGTTKVDVGVKGSASQPAFATIAWTTPAAPGHFCLQALLDPVDDLDFSNNIGQENTDVAAAQSPASFSFALRNDTKRTRHYRFACDAYAIPALPQCGSPEAARDVILERHRRVNHPVPPGFAIAIAPEAPVLAPGAQTTITVAVTPPPGWGGRQPINVNGFHEAGFAGGVSLIVTAGV